MNKSNEQFKNFLMSRVAVACEIIIYRRVCLVSCRNLTYRTMMIVPASFRVSDGYGLLWNVSNWIYSIVLVSGGQQSVDSLTVSFIDHMDKCQY